MKNYVEMLGYELSREGFDKFCAALKKGARVRQRPLDAYHAKMERQMCSDFCAFFVERGIMSADECAYKINQVL